MVVDRAFMVLLLGLHVCRWTALPSPPCHGDETTMRLRRYYDETTMSIQ